MYIYPWKPAFITTVQSIMRTILQYITLSHHYADFYEGIEYIFFYQICSVEFVYRIQSILSIILYAVLGTVRSQLTHFACDDYEDVFT